MIVMYRKPQERKRLIVVQDEKRETGHAVVAVRYEQRWLILDNRTMAIPDAGRARLSATVCARPERHAGNCDRVERSHHKSIIWPSLATIVPARTSVASAASLSMKSSSCDGS